jgi:hypothetical protein
MEDKMPEFNVDAKKLALLIWEELQLEEVKTSIVALKGIDWNPFNEDLDEHVGAWAEMQHNWDLLWDVALKVVQAVQRVLVGGLSLASPQKHAAAVKILDDLIRAPWYVEPFDGTVIDMLIKSAVKFMQSVNWGVELPEFPNAQIAFREV